MGQQGAGILTLLTAAGYKVHRIDAAGEPVAFGAHEQPDDENVLALPVERTL